MPSKLIRTICSAASPEWFISVLLLPFDFFVPPDDSGLFFDTLGALGYIIT
jgi:hypothetical protein